MSLGLRDLQQVEPKIKSDLFVIEVKITIICSNFANY